MEKKKSKLKECFACKYFIIVVIAFVIMLGLTIYQQMN
jgi:hypothetical protein